MKKSAKILEASENAEVFIRTETGDSPPRKGPSKKKIVVILVIITAVAVAAGFFLSRQKPDLGPIVSVETVERMNLEQTVAIKGTIEGSESADVASALNYKITAIYVQEGDLVQKNQVLATLDIGDLKDSYNKALLAQRESKRTLDSAELLYEEGAMSQDEYLRHKATYENDTLTLSSFDIGEKQNIRSPISGTVTRVNVTIGRYASETENNQAMFVVENLSDLQMKVRISEYDINKIQVGQNATITADVLGSQSVTGKVAKISPTGEAKDMSSTEKVVPVVIDIDKGNMNLIAGVTAKATILIEKRENVLAVSIDAIAEDPETGETSIFVVGEEGILKKVPVVLGLEGNLNVEIQEGDIAEGDQVVLAPTFDLEDGSKVQIEPIL